MHMQHYLRNMKQTYIGSYTQCGNVEDALDVVLEAALQIF